MPGPRTRRPRTNRVYQQMMVSDMTAGLDLRRDPTQVRDDRSRLLMNWSIDEPGALKVRPGYVQYSSASLGARRIQGAERVYLSSHTMTLASYLGDVYRLTGTSWNTAIYSTISSAADVFFPYDRDMVSVFDGTNQMVKSTDGSTWTQFGITFPDSASSLSTVASGDLIAGKKYEINYTYESAFPHESNGSSSPTTLTLTGSTSAINVEVRGSTDPQVTKVNFYARNVTDGETIRRKASSAANQSDGSTLSVNIASSAWLSNAEEPSDHNVPPVLSFGVVWKNRWWARHASVKNRLYFTQVFQAQSWPATFFIDIPFPRGDSIEALIPIGDTLLVFGATDIFVIFGQTSLDFEVRPALDAQDGALGPRAVEVIENGVIHAGARGVYIFDGVSDRLLSHDIEKGWFDLVQNGSSDDIKKIDVVYDESRKEVRVATPRMYPTTSAGEWVLDLNRTRIGEEPAWTQTDRMIGGYIHWHGAETSIADRGTLQSWSDTAGLVFTESTGTTANSSNLEAEYRGPVFVATPHRLRAIDTYGEYEPNDGVFSIETLVDDKSMGNISIDVGAGLSKYGIAVYGTATYGGVGRKRYFRMLPLKAEGRSFQRTMKYVGQSAFKTYTYGYGIVPETAPLEVSD